MSYARILQCPNKGNNGIKSTTILRVPVRYYVHSTYRDYMLLKRVKYACFLQSLITVSPKVYQIEKI